MSEEMNPVQGMYAAVNDRPARRCTVTMSDVSLTVYEEVNLFNFTPHKVDQCFPSVAASCQATIDRSVFNQDFKDLIVAVEKVQRTTMSLRSGDKIITNVAKQIVQDEATGYLEFAPEREEWWMGNPHIQPIIVSIQSYLPDFAPWRGLGDNYISLFSRRSTLL